MDEAKCPVMHGAISRNSGGGTSNREWWPNQLNLNILHQHDKKSSPLDIDFNYREAFSKLETRSFSVKPNFKSLAKEIPCSTF